MQRLRTLLSLLPLAALAACGSATTAPTDEDLVGTWSLEPATVSLPGGGMRQMTVHFGDGGAYTLETATYRGAGTDEMVAYDKTVGSVSVDHGELRFHPTGSVSWSRDHLHMPLVDSRPWLRAPLSYTVEGDHLVLRSPREGEGDSVVLTRRDE